MLSVLRLIILLGLATSAWAQLDSESIPPELDQRDLYVRAAASRVVIIGTVIKSEGKSERVPPEQLQDRLNKGTVRGGSLKTVRVDEIVCRQSDFDDTVPEVDNRPQPFFLFIPFDESDLPNGDFREVLLPNKRYLLLLTELDTPSLSAVWELDPNLIYYRGTGHNRGVIPFEPTTLLSPPHTIPEVVDKFRKLCTAMRPAKPEDKLALLQHLAESGDPVLKKEAEIAEDAVKAKMKPTQQPKDQVR